MPQMMPLSWHLYFILISVTLLFMIFSSFSSKKISSRTNLTFHKFFWKW